MTILEHNIFDEEVARIEESNYVFKYIKDGYNVLNKTYTPIRVFDKYGNFYKDYSSYTAAAKEFEVEPCREFYEKDPEFSLINPILENWYEL